jgi:hypothetical protein
VSARRETIRPVGIEPQPPLPGHHTRHVTGLPVTCRCGWETPRPVSDQATGVRYAMAHLAEVRQLMTGAR